MKYTVSIALLLLCPTVKADGPGKTVVRVQDPSGSHCINGSTEQVSLFVKRIWTEKTSGIFTEDNKAGVIVRTDLDGGDDKAHIPSVNFASIADDQNGHVSLALEYPIMKRFPLKQGTTVTSGVNVDVYLAKTRGRNTFGDIVDIAGKALAQIPVPANPYTTTAQQFLKFANDSIDKATQDDIENLVAQINLNFADRDIADLNACHNAGDEYTGAIAVLLSTGQQDGSLIPIQDADKRFCFSYSSRSVFGLTSTPMPDNHVCPSDPAQYSEVPNDYVLFILNAQQPVPPPPHDTRFIARLRTRNSESRKRCSFYGLPRSICD